MTSTVAMLIGRLRAGDQMINAEANPEKREQLEAFWIDLLHQYEVAADAELDHVLPSEDDQ